MPQTNLPEYLDALNFYDESSVFKDITNIFELIKEFDPQWNLALNWNKAMSATDPIKAKADLLNSISAGKLGDKDLSESFLLNWVKKYNASVASIQAKVTDKSLFTGLSDSIASIVLIPTLWATDETIPFTNKKDGDILRQPHVSSQEVFSKTSTTLSDTMSFKVRVNKLQSQNIKCAMGDFDKERALNLTKSSLSVTSHSCNLIRDYKHIQRMGGIKTACINAIHEALGAIFSFSSQLIVYTPADKVKANTKHTFNGKITLYVEGETMQVDILGRRIKPDVMPLRNSINGRLASVS